MSARLLLPAAILGVIVLHALWHGWRVNRARRSISVAGGAAAVPRIDPGWEAVGAAIWPTRSTVSHAVRARPALRVVLLSLVAGRIRGLRESLKWGAGQLKRSAASLLAAAAVTLAIAAWSDATGLLAVNSGGTLELVKTTDAAVVDAGDEIGFGIDLTNRRADPGHGRVIIEKLVEPNRASATFTFAGDLPAPEFSLSPGLATRTFPAIVAGTYTVTERDLPELVSLTDLARHDVNSTVDLATRTATIRLDPGETVRCRFTNTDSGAEPNGLGRVIIEKQAPADQKPDLEPGGTFETDVPGCGGRFNLGATGEVARSSLFPGTDEVTETVIGGHAVAIIGLAVVWPIVLGGS
jgi:hypothetical protein